MSYKATEMNGLLPQGMDEFSQGSLESGKHMDVDLGNNDCDNPPHFIPPENDNINYNEVILVNNMEYHRKRHPLMFVNLAHLSFVMEMDTTPIKCAKCGSRFSRSIESKTLRFKCKSDQCNNVVLTYDMKAFLIDLYNHKIINIIPSKNKNGSPYSLVFKADKKETKVIPLGWKNYLQDLRKPILMEPTFPNPTAYSKICTKNVLDLRKAIHCEYDFIIEEKYPDSPIPKIFDDIFYEFGNNQCTSNNNKKTIRSNNSSANVSNAFSIENYFRQKMEEAQLLQQKQQRNHVEKKGGEEEEIEEIEEIEETKETEIMEYEDNPDLINNLLNPLQNFTLDDINRIRKTIYQVTLNVNKINKNLQDKEILLDKKLSILQKSIEEYIKNFMNNYSSPSSLVMPSVSYAKKASMKANSSSRKNAIVEHRKYVHKVYEEEKKKKENKCQTIDDAFQYRFNDRLPNTVKEKFKENRKLFGESLIGLTTAMPKKYNPDDFTTVYIKGIERKPIRNVREMFEMLGIKKKNLKNISFIKSNICEIVILKTFLATFESFINCCSEIEGINIEYLKGFNPYKCMDIESPSFKDIQNVEQAYCNRVFGIVARVECPDYIKEFFDNELTKATFQTLVYKDGLIHEKNNELMDEYDDEINYYELMGGGEYDNEINHYELMGGGEYDNEINQEEINSNFNNTNTDTNTHAPSTSTTTIATTSSPTIYVAATQTTTTNSEYVAETPNTKTNGIFDSPSYVATTQMTGNINNLSTISKRKINTNDENENEDENQKKSKSIKLTKLSAMYKGDYKNTLVSSGNSSTPPPINGDIIDDDIISSRPSSNLKQSSEIEISSSPIMPTLIPSSPDVISETPKEIIKKNKKKNYYEEDNSESEEIDDEKDSDYLPSEN